MVPARDGLVLAAVLFALGLAGLLVRRNVIFILTMAAAEVSVGLALVLQLYRQYQSVDVDAASKMKG